VLSKAILGLALTFVFVIFLSGIGAYAKSGNTSSTSDANMFDEPARMSANASNATTSSNITVFDEPACTP
jgi:hypothetical protein